MKKVLLRALSCLVVAVALLVLASRWTTLFWLLVLAVVLYLFGRKVVMELRLGVSGDATERRVYEALVWTRGGIAQERADQCQAGQLEVSTAGRHG